MRSMKIYCFRKATTPESMRSDSCAMICSNAIRRQYTEVDWLEKSTTLQNDKFWLAQMANPYSLVMDIYRSPVLTGYSSLHLLEFSDGPS
jgi:hypothetical protein